MNRRGFLRSLFAAAVAAPLAPAAIVAALQKPVPQFTYGTVTLKCKEMHFLVKCPNELLRFATPACETLLRDEMVKKVVIQCDWIFEKPEILS